MTEVCTTPTTEAPVERPTFDVCPPWCAGHLDGYQRWEQWPDGSIRRYHDDHGVLIGGVSVVVGIEEVLEQGLGLPRVDVTFNSVDDESVELTDGDAHELGLAIVRASDTARRWRLAQEAGR